MTKPNPLLWTGVIATAASFGSYFFACVFPFAAVATIAALTLPRWQAVGLMTAVWAVNQLVGFTLMNYPLDSWALGGSLLVGALAGVAAARTIPARIGSPRSLLPLALAFIAYEAVTAAFAWFLGGFSTYTDANIVFGVALNDLGWFLVLSGAYRLLTLRASPSREALTTN